MEVIGAENEEIVQNITQEDPIPENPVGFPADFVEKLCDLITFGELKRFRLVCRAWNTTVSQHPRLKNCRAVFRSDWLTKARGLNIESTLQWKSVYFSFFPWTRNTLFAPYWAHAGQNVTILNFKYYKLPCTDMVALLNSIPQLVELTLNKCTFEMTRVPLPDKPKVKFIRSCCPHENLVVPPEANPVPPARIRLLRLIYADCFPLCILDLLTQRTNGTLQVFQYDHARIGTWKRQYYLPTREKVQAFVIQMFRNNVATLREFNFIRNFRGDLVLRQLANRNTAQITSEIVTIGQQASWRFMETSPAFMNFIDRLNAENLQRLSIRFIHRYNGSHLGQVVVLKHNLRFLAVDSVWCDQGSPFNLASLFPNLPNLEGFHIKDRNRRKQPSMSHDYLTTQLPVNVTSVAFYSYYIEEANIRTFIQSASARRLHTLLIEGGRFVTDDTFQLLIRTLPQLEVLAVNDSTYLTDAGVTGLSLKTVKEILKCQQRAVLTGEFQLDDLPGIPVSRMTNLRKLSLGGCRHLSDITISVGIKFSNLREIDLSRCLNVTDIGLIRLSEHNPSLERVVIIKNLKITHYGLNQALINNPCIENIHTSKRVRDRKMGKQVPYTVCDRFETAVTYCHWDERRARPMFSD